MERTGTGDTLRNPKTAEWLREWLEAKEATKAATTHTRYKGTVDDFITYLGARANRPLVAIVPRDIQGFIDWRAKQKVGPSTLNVEGKILRSAFNRARKLGLIQGNPAEAVDLPARQSIERGTFTPTEVQLLADAAEVASKLPKARAADKEWKTLILLGYYTGARLSECCRVAWNDIDLAKGTISFPVTKAGKGKAHVMPLHPELTTHLESIAGDKPGPIMPHLANVRVSGRRGLSQHFLGIMAKAGLDAEKVDGAGKRQLHKRTFHALRHSFNSALANAGVSPEVRMKLIGHRSAAVNRGYTHHELETLKAELAKLPKATQ
jgi:integrase